MLIKVQSGPGIHVVHTLFWDQAFGSIMNIISCLDHVVNFCEYSQNVPGRFFCSVLTLPKSIQKSPQKKQTDLAISILLLNPE